MVALDYKNKMFNTWWGISQKNIIDMNTINDRRINS